MRFRNSEIHWCLFYNRNLRFRNMTYEVFEGIFEKIMQEVCFPAISFTHNLNEKFPFSESVIMINKYDLLPGSQYQFSIWKRHCYSWPHKGGSYMRKAIVITPGLWMAAVHGGWSKLFQLIFKIFHKSIFIFDCGNRCSWTDNKYVYQSVFKLWIDDNLTDFICYFTDIRKASGL